MLTDPYQCPPAPRPPLAALALAGAALAVCYAPFLGGMAAQWLSDEDMGHGFVVPMVVAWILWRERARLGAIAARPSLWGFALLALGATLHAAAAFGAGLFAGSLAFLISLAGLVIAFAGFGMLRACAFPFLLSLFMLPKLAIVYNQVTLPLQLLASRMAAAGLTALGVGVLRDGNILAVHGNQVAVAEACSGIRYLLPLGLLTLVFGYVAAAKKGPRMLVFCLSVPLAILANALRVAAAAAYPPLASGTLHMLFGGVVFALSLALAAAALHLFGKLQERLDA
jgi:exosortase